MKRCDVLGSGHELLSSSSLRVSVRLKISFCIRLGRGLRSGVLHQLLIIRLSIFLARLCLCKLLVQILDQKIQHRNHPTGFPGLSSVCPPCFRRCCRGCPLLLVHRHLCQHCNACPGNTRWRGCREDTTWIP